ncbi:hypothetical protein HD806DRAFT_93795 [Xylariaceae sp. AK1471]|nr:hypothetical protein HD806DRAFT_93795 [Xylariaceae sp. AK1471]
MLVLRAYILNFSQPVTSLPASLPSTLNKTRIVVHNPPTTRIVPSPYTTQPLHLQACLASSFLQLQLFSGFRSPRIPPDQVLWRYLWRCGKKKKKSPLGWKKRLAPSSPLPKYASDGCILPRYALVFKTRNGPAGTTKIIKENCCCGESAFPFMLGDCYNRSARLRRRMVFEKTRGWFIDVLGDELTSSKPDW